MTVDDALNMIRIADVLVSPDGEWAFFSESELDWDENKRKKKYYMIPAGGGEATKLTDHENDVESYKWSPDGRGIVFTANEALSEERQKEHDKGADAYYVREGPHGREEGSWRNLWTFDLSSMDETRLTDEKLVISEFDISPSGERVVFAAAALELFLLVRALSGQHTEEESCPAHEQ